MNSPPDPALAALWEQVNEHWDSEEAHRAFLDASAIRKDLSFAATRYRDMKADEPNRAPRCEQQLQAITAMALAQLQATKSDPRKTPRAIVWIGFIVSLGLIAGSIFAMTR